MPKVADKLVAIFVSKTKDFMNAIQILGLVAGSLTTAAFLPQVIKNLEKPLGERPLTRNVLSVLPRSGYVACLWLRCKRHPSDSGQSAYVVACFNASVF